MQNTSGFKLDASYQQAVCKILIQSSFSLLYFLLLSENSKYSMAGHFLNKSLS